MNFDNFGKLIFDLLTNLSGGLEVRRANQKGPIPAGPFIVWNYLSGIGGEAPEYFGNARFNEAENKIILNSFTAGGITISVSAYGANSLSTIQTIRKKIKANQGREALAQLGIAYGLTLVIVDASTIQDLTALVQSNYDSRFSIDISLRFTDLLSEEVDFIETAEPEGTIGN